MAAKGKWAQGITPRHFHWVIQDQLAVCERPGGYGSNHRKIRRQEEIIWIREQGFSPVFSVIPAPRNLHNYDELSVKWVHRPFPLPEDYATYLVGFYPELHALLNGGHKVLLHHEELGDKVVGLMAGYLVWSGKVPEEPKAIFLMEHICERQLEPRGREIVSVAGQLANARGPA